MSILNNSLLLGADAAAGGYQVSRSLRFNSSDSAYCSRVFSSAGNRKTWTWAAWVKRSALGSTQQLFASRPTSSPYSLFYFFSDDKLAFDNGISSFTTNAVFRDTSAWYHVVLCWDSTQATASNRIKLYVNNVEQSFSASAYPTQNADGQINTATNHAIGKGGDFTNEYFNGYLADVHFIDGQALTPSSFTEVSATTGQLIPKAYTGSFGTNGFWLKFSDNSAATATTLGKDYSGNSNNWTPNNLSVITGGPTSVAAASGALPIYNTTDTYGTTKGTGTRTDANASSLVLAIPMDGANNGTTFTDESATIRGSGSAKTLTRTGFITSTAQSKYYGSAGFSDTNYNSITVASSTDFDFGTGNFTIECWTYPISITSYGIIFQTAGSNTAGSVYLYLSPIGTVVLETFTGSSRPNVSQTGIIQNAWNHVAAVRSGNNWTLYVNGIAGSSVTITQSLTSTTPRIGSNADETGNGRFNGYIQDLRIYKGVAKYTANFNPPSSTQNPAIAPGNDSLVDTPTSYGTDDSLGGSVRGNYATLNPLAGGASGMSNGNLEFTAATTPAFGTIQIPLSGKYYFEAVPTAVTNSSLRMSVGACDVAYQNDGTKYIAGSTTSYGASYTTNDVIGVAVDADNNQITFYKNNVSQGVISQTFGAVRSVSCYTTTATTDRWVLNFGQRPFAYTAPSGFKALCDTNLPAPVVAKPSTVMDVVLWTGNGSNSGRSLTGLNFNPDLVWTKTRSEAFNHLIYDAVRLAGSGKELSSSSTAAEGGQSSSSYGYLSSFDSSGFSFTPGSDAFPANIGWYNTTNRTYAAWCWDAGSSTVTNTQGSITSQVRANASAGFSIVTASVSASASGPTIGHGLGVTPALVIGKNRSAAINWYVWNASLPANNKLELQSTAAATTSTTTWGAMTSSTLQMGATGTAVNVSWVVSGTQDFVFYCFAPVAGYSSFGSYTGNGSADGPFVFCGFRPRWILLKSSSTTGSWCIYDTARNTYNLTNLGLYPNYSSAEGTETSNAIDVLSNGFKLRGVGGSDPALNGNGQTIVYAAFAESPFQYARAR